ncbi:RNA polymerase sigma factor [Actinomadura sp. NAK00032]|uniref:RNA polymerase sigma factor n=1 Tax=Actinomadura sp. NAK00032 TaxID=2742128 RepID=UPI0026753D6A|nr:sigma-70 family RNA polymerase sigma factor [Actinomadura sp. NAK00032]
MGEHEFSRFVEQARAWLCKRVTKITFYMGGIADADDIVQDALVIAYVRWDRVRTMADRRSYVAEIARNNLAIRAARSVYKELPTGDVTRNDHRAFDNTLQVLDQVLVDQLLDRLTTREAEVILFRNYGFSSSDIAAILECAPSTVRSTHRHARSRLRDLLTKVNQNTETTDEPQLARRASAHVDAHWGGHRGSGF